MVEDVVGDTSRQSKAWLITEDFEIDISAGNDGSVPSYTQLSEYTKVPISFLRFFSFNNIHWKDYIFFHEKLGAFLSDSS